MRRRFERRGHRLDPRVRRQEGAARGGGHQGSSRRGRGHSIGRDQRTGQGEKLVALSVRQRVRGLSYDRADSLVGRDRNGDGSGGRQSLGLRLLRGATESAPPEIFQLCLAHQLRDLNRVMENYPDDWWASAMHGLFREAIHLRNRFVSDVMTLSGFMRPVAQLENQLDRLLDEKL